MNNHLILIKAASFAAEKHKFQKRKGDLSPYINHPLGVAKILVEIGEVTDYITLSAAILHDTLEDTNTTKEELIKEFGEDINSVVCEVTDDRSLNKENRKRLQIEHAKIISNRAKLIKLADKIHNLNSLKYSTPSNWSKEYIQGYSLWSLMVVNNLRGCSIKLEETFDNILKDKLFVNNKEIDFLPNGCLNEKLEEFYKLCN